MECWVYVRSGAAFNTPSATDAGFMFCGDSATTSYRSVEFNIYRGELRAGLYNSDASSATYIAGGTINDATWYHVALSRTASNAWAIYVDGTRVATSTAVKTLPQNSNNGQIAIGARIEGGSLGQYFDGYIDDFRITRGVGRYSGSSFTAPTTALTDDKDTVLLLHMDGGGPGTPGSSTNIGQGTYFYDDSTNAIFYNSGVPKYKSYMTFDGSGDYLTVPDSTDWAFGTNNFTVEFWMNHQSLSTGNVGIALSPSTDKRQLFGYIDGGDGLFKIYLTSDGSNWDIASGVSMGTARLDTWIHYAVVRNGTTFYTFQNGTQISTFTSSASMYDSSHALSIGRYAGGSELNGRMDQIRISNSARYTSNFTPPTDRFTADANTKLLIQSDFTDGGIGADHSGNYNYFTPTNLGSEDMVEDSPTNNFATINPLSNAGAALSEGNLKGVYSTHDAGWLGTFGATSGKWYWETLVIGHASAVIGIANTATELKTNRSSSAGVYAIQNAGGSYAYYRNNGSTGQSAGFPNMGVGDIVNCALDMDNNKFYIGVNGTYYNLSGTTGNPASGTNETYSSLAALRNSSTWSPFAEYRVASVQGTISNFGQDSSFAGARTAQGNQDGNGIGDFYYSPPSGFLALCSDNLSDPSIADPTDHFNTVLYAGNGGTQSVTVAGFAPDFVWIKNRTDAVNHGLFDTIRGVKNSLQSNTTTEARTAAGATEDLYAFGSDGFSVGVDTGGTSYINCNESSKNYASWNWKAGGTAVSNTDGTITSSVSANTTAGFSVGTYTGDGSASSTVGTGLSSLDMVIIRNRDESRGWVVKTKDLTSGYKLGLDQAIAQISASSSNQGGIADLSGDTFSFISGASGINDVNDSGDDYVFYAFESIDGYSKVGSYTGNGSTAGPFVYTGFRPSFVMIKNTGTTTEWVMVDNKRDPYNVTENLLYPDADTAEGTQASNKCDLLSNGFKLHGNGGAMNGANTIIYLAFAESPFKTSNAR